MSLADSLVSLPLVAVLRGITPDEVPAVGAALHAEGFRILEVPLNSPRPFESIRLLDEAFAAIAAGADALKLFPAEAMLPAALRAWRAVLPKGALVFAVGGIRPDTLAPWWEAGADGFGTGSNLYKPGANVADVRAAAAAYAAAFRALPRRR